MIIHSGRPPERKNASTTFRRFANFFGFSSVVASAISTRNSSRNFSRSISSSMTRTASAPMPATNVSSPYSSWASKYSSSDKSCPFFSGDRSGSSTMKCSKYNTRSRSFSVMSSNRPMRLGRDFKNQICATGAASSICPMRSRRTLVRVTSTPHFSQMTPLNFIRLYLPHRHS